MSWVQEGGKEKLMRVEHVQRYQISPSLMLRVNVIPLYNRLFILTVQQPMAK